MKSEKDDFFWAKGFGLIALLTLFSGFMAATACELIDPSCWWGFALFGSGVGLLTGVLIRMRYAVFGLVGNAASLLYAFYVLTPQIRSHEDSVYPVQRMIVVTFLAMAANIPLFWKFYQLQQTRATLARSKLSHNTQNPR